MKESQTIQIYPRNKYSPIMDRVIFFGMLCGLFYVNKAYMDSAIPNWVLTVLFLLALVAVITKTVKKTTFDNPDEAKAFIDKYYDR